MTSKVEKEKRKNPPKKGCRHWAVHNVKEETIRSIRAIAELQGKTTGEVISVLLESHSTLETLLRK